MSRRVVVVDYGVGNLRSVARALEAVGAEPDVTDDVSAVADAERLILPGVGAFRSCAEALESRGLKQPVLDYFASGRPALGICVGMQMLFEGSEEFGRTPGLGVMPGEVAALNLTTADGAVIRSPFIGWSPLSPAAEERPDAWDGTILNGVAPGSSVYFVHSFAACPIDEGQRLAISDYGAGSVCAAVRHGALYGVQFHPERSGPTGLKILANFVGL